MNVWSITQETHEKQITLRRNGELEYPNIMHNDNTELTVAKYIDWVLIHMQTRDVLSVCFSKTG